MPFESRILLHVWHDLPFFTIWWTQCWTMPWNSTSILNCSTSFVCRLNACPNLVDLFYQEPHWHCVTRNGYIRKYRRLSICIKTGLSPDIQGIKESKGGNEGKFLSYRCKLSLHLYKTCRNTTILSWNNSNLI